MAPALAADRCRSRQCTADCSRGFPIADGRDVATGVALRARAGAVPTMTERRYAALARRARPLVSPARRPIVTASPKRRQWRLFALGLGVRLVGVALIWAGDGSPALWRKALVVVGVVLSVGGIAVLRYLLLAGPLSRLSARWRRV